MCVHMFAVFEKTSKDRVDRSSRRGGKTDFSALSGTGSLVRHSSSFVSLVLFALDDIDNMLNVSFP